MNTAGAKAKGRSLQNRVAKDLAQVTGLRYGSPNDDLADLRGRLMGTPGEDIVRSKDARCLVPFYIECKNTESWSFGKRLFDDGLGQLIRWYFGTEDKSLKTGNVQQNIPLVIAAKAHCSPIVVVGDRRASLSPRWNTDSLICLRVPLYSFMEDKWRHLAIPDSAINILDWQAFLDMWYGK